VPRWPVLLRVRDARELHFVHRRWRLWRLRGWLRCRPGRLRQWYPDWRPAAVRLRPAHLPHVAVLCRRRWRWPCGPPAVRLPAPPPASLLLLDRGFARRCPSLRGAVAAAARQVFAVGTQGHDGDEDEDDDDDEEEEEEEEEKEEEDEVAARRPTQSYNNTGLIVLCVAHTAWWQDC